MTRKLATAASFDAATAPAPRATLTASEPAYASKGYFGASPLQRSIVTSIAAISSPAANENVFPAVGETLCESATAPTRKTVSGVFKYVLVLSMNPFGINRNRISAVCE